ncbi:hypothetical protein HDV05_002772 [Chytridiales sp. JEL 0842]|nr:hypothetical protein HDV05_002772 [Chytridiales sp. JEL 0842]
MLAQIGFIITTLALVADAKQYIKHIPTGLCLDVVNWTDGKHVPYLNTCQKDNPQQHFQDRQWATGLYRSDRCLFADTNGAIQDRTALVFAGNAMCGNTGAHYQAHWSVDNNNKHLYLNYNGRQYCMDAGTGDGVPKVGSRVYLFQCINGERNQDFQRCLTSKRTLLLAADSSKPLLPVYIPPSSPTQKRPTWVSALVSGLEGIAIEMDLLQDAADLQTDWDLLMDDAAEMIKKRDPSGSPMRSCSSFSRGSVTASSLSSSRPSSVDLPGGSPGRPQSITVNATTRSRSSLRRSISIQKMLTGSPTMLASKPSKWKLSQQQQQQITATGETRSEMSVKSDIEIAREWLKPHLVDEFENLASMLHPSTRTEVLEELTKWALDPPPAADSTSTLSKRSVLLHGPAGSGKSVLTAHLLSKLQQPTPTSLSSRTTHTNTLLTSYTLLSSTDTRRSCISTTFNTLSFRLAQRSPPFLQALLQLYKLDPEIANPETAPPMRFRKLIVDPLNAVLLDPPNFSGSGKALLVLDGLDELERGVRRELVLAIRGEWERLGQGVKVLFTVRDTQSVDDLDVLKKEMGVVLAGGWDVELAGVMQRMDLLAYARSVVVEEILERGGVEMTGEEEEYVEEACLTLMGKSGESYLWMRWALMPLYTAKLENGGGSGLNAKEVYHMVENLPDGLGDLIQSVLTTEFHGASEDLISYFPRVMGLLIGLKQPMSINAFASLIELDVTIVRRIFARAHPFIELVVTPNTSTFEKDPQFQLIHPSFAEYLTHHCLDPLFRIDLPAIEAELSLRCLSKLCTQLKPNPLDLQDPGAWFNAEIPDFDVRLEVKVSEALRYACRMWGAHLEDVGRRSWSGTSSNSLDARIHEAMERLVGMVCVDKLLEWIEHLSLMGDVERVGGLVLRQVLGYLDSIQPASTWEQVVGFVQRNAARMGGALNKEDGVQTGPSAYLFEPDGTLDRLLPKSQAPMSSTPLSPLSPLSPSTTTSPITPSNPLVGTRINPAHLKPLLKDTLRLLSTYRTPLTHSAFHVHLTALPFSPRSSTLFETYIPKVHKAVISSSLSSLSRRVPQVLRGTPDTWSPCLWTLRSHTRLVSAVCVSMDGRWIVSGGYDRSVRVWEAETGMLSRVLEGHEDQVWHVSCSKDGRWIVSGGYDGTVRNWNASTGKCMKVSKGKTWSVNSLTMTLDGSKIVSVSGVADRGVVVRDAESGETVWNLKGHQGTVVCVAVSPDGSKIVSGSEDKTVRLWDLHTGRGIRTMEGHANTVNAVCVSPDGRWVVSGSKDTTCRVWDINNGKCVQVLEGHQLSVNCVAISPDGERIVSGSDDRTVKVWECDLARRLRNGGGDLLKGLESDELKGHGDTIKALEISEDGRFLVSAGSDLTVKVWSAETGKLVKSIEARALNAPTWDEAVKRVCNNQMEEYRQQQNPSKSNLSTKTDAADTKQATPLSSSVQIKKRSNSKMVMVIVNGKSKLMTQEEAELLQNETKSNHQDVEKEKILPVANSVDSMKDAHDEVEALPSLVAKLGVVGSQNGGDCWVFGEDGWVLDKKEGTRRFWLPVNLRGMIRSYQGRIVAIGTEAGQVVILHV